MIGQDKKERILIIPGSEAQIALLEEAREAGYETVCINPYKDSPGFQYADYSEQADILDKEKVLQIAKEYAVSAVISDECDIAMPTVAYVGEQMGLRTISRSDAELYTDKFLMREFCREHGYLFPEYAKCATIGEATAFYDSLSKKKMIMKPLDSNSSRGVYTVNQREDIAEYFEESLRYSKKEHAVICERYIDGPEFTVDGIVVKGKHYSLAISQKKHYEYNPNIAYELFFSYSNPNYDYDLLRKINDSYVEATNLKMGFTHAEYKCENNKFYLIEIGARGGGNYISSHIVDKLVDLDNYGMLFRQSLGQEEYTEKFEFYRERCAVLEFFDIDKAGTVKEIKNEKILSDNPHVVKYQFHFNIGDRIAKAENDSKRVGYYIAYCESRNELEYLMKEIAEKVKIIVE